MDEKIAQLQKIEQNLQSYSIQKQQVQNSLHEVEQALKEISNTEKSFKMVGSIMVEQSSETLTKELQDQKERLSVRVQTLQNQEDKLRSKAQELQKEVMANMGDENGSK